MIFLNHNFYSNFSGSLKSGDVSVTSDILVNELSDFIVYDTKKIVDAMNKAGVKVSESDADEEITDAFIANVSTNPKLSKAIAFIIAESNELINTGKGDKTEWKKVIDNISSGVDSVSKGISSNKIAFKDDLMQNIKTKAESKGDYKRTIFTKDKSTSKGVKIIFIGLGVIALGLFVISRIQKNQLKMENGGAIIPNIPTAPTSTLPPINPTAPEIAVPSNVQPIQTPTPTATPMNNVPIQAQPIQQPSTMI